MPKRTGSAAIFIVVAVVAVAAIAGGYFFLTKSGKVPSIPGIPGGVTLNPNCKYNDPDLCKFINNFKETKNYGSKSVSSDKSGSFEAVFEMMGEGKTHMAYSQDGKENYNLITIGDVTYTKDYSDNKWWKQKQVKASPLPKDQKTEAANIQDQITKSDQAEDKTTYKKIGMEACGPLQCFKYQMIDPANTETTEYIWFDNKDYLMRRERSEGKDGTVTDTTVYYDKINISAPSPTKDAGPDQVISPTGGFPGISQEELKNIQDAAGQLQQLAPQVDQTQQDQPQPDTSTGGE